MESNIDFSFVGEYVRSKVEQRVSKLERRNGTKYYLSSISMGDVSDSKHQYPFRFTVKLDGENGTHESIYGSFEL